MSLAVVFVVALNFIVFVNPAKADWDGFWSGMAERFFGVIIGVEGWAIARASEGLITVMNYNGFVSSYAVQIGWTLVRDVANLFFVVVLLAIAIGTILRIESYNFKKLLPKLLIMAILVNFSRLICGLIIDFAQVIMMIFAVAFYKMTGTAQTVGGQSYGATAANLIKILNIDKIFAAREVTRDASDADRSTGLGTLIMTGMVAVVLLLIAFLVILVNLVVIIMRIIMLWLLVVLSPLPFILSAFPQGQRYAQQWWQEFSKYVLIGPMLAFFLWLSFAIANGMDGNAGGRISLDPGNTDKATEATEATEAATTSGPTVFTGIGDFESVLSMILGIGMLLGSLMLTQQMSVAGGQAAGAMFGRIRGAGMAAVTKPLSGALGGVKMGTRGVGRVWDRYMARRSASGKFGARLAGFLSPTTVKKGWEASRLEAEQQSFPQAAGRMQDFLNKKIRDKETTHEKIAFQSEVSSRQSDVEKAQLSEIEHSKLFDEAINSGNAVEIAALGRVLVANNQFDDYAGIKGIEHAPGSLKQHLVERLNDSVGEEMSANIGVNWSEYSESVGKYRLGNYARTVATFDDKGNPISKNVWLDENYAKETLEQENREAEANGEPTTKITDDAVRKRMEQQSMAWWETKAGRVTTEQFIQQKEGKMYRVLLANAQNVLDFASDTDGGTFSSHFANYDDEGILRAKAEDDDKEAEVINTRRHRIQSRYKETIGIESKGGRLHLNIEALADLFRAGRHETAVNALVHSGLSTKKLAEVEAGLQEMGIENRAEDGGGALDFNNYGGNNAQPKLAEMTGQREAARQGVMFKSAAFKDLAADYRTEHFSGAGAGAGATGPSAPRMAQDFDEEKYNRTQDMVREYTAIDADFFESSEYDPNEFESEKEFHWHDYVLNRRDADKIVFPWNVEENASQAGVGLNFDNEEIAKILGVSNGMGGAYYDGDIKEEIIDKIADIHLGQLLEKKESGELKITKEGIEKAINRVNEGLNRAATLRVFNTRSTDPHEDIKGHEEAHAPTLGMSDNQLDKFWNSMSEEQQEQISADIKKRYGDNISEENIKREAIAEVSGVGKGIYKSGNKTNGVLDEMGIEHGGGTVEDTVKKVSQAGAVLKATKSKIKGATYNQIIKAISNLSDVASDRVEAISENINKVIGYVKNEGLRSALGKYRESQLEMNSSKKKYERIKHSEGSMVKEKEKEKRQRQGEAKKLFEEAEKAEKGGNVAEAKEKTSKGNQAIERAEYIDSEISDSRGRLKKARDEHSEKVDRAIKAKRKADSLSPMTEASPEAKQAVQQAAKAETPEKARQATENVEPQEVITVAQEEVEKQAQEVQKAVVSNDTEGVVGALLSLENILTSVKSSLDKLPSSRSQKGNKDFLNGALKDIKDYRSTVHGDNALDPNSITAWLQKVNANLIRISRQSSVNARRMPSQPTARGGGSSKK